MNNTFDIDLIKKKCEDFERNATAAAQEEKNRSKKEALKIHSKAVERYRQQKYEEANMLFLESLGKFTYVCLKSDPELALVYYNLGKCCLKIEDYDSAGFFLNTNSILKRDYTLPKPEPEEIKK